MDATMHIGMLVSVIVVHRLNDALRFLAAGARIEVHQVTSVDLSVQDRKLRANGLDIKPAHNTSWANRASR